MYLLITLLALIGLGCLAAIGYFLLGIHDEDHFNWSRKFLGYEWTLNIGKKQEFIFSIKNPAKAADNPASE